MLSLHHLFLSKTLSRKSVKRTLPNYYESQNCNNSYIDKIVLYNSETKKWFKPKCKSYSCPKHGFIQRERLAKAIEQWLRGHNIIRFWTFTARFDNSKPMAPQNESYRLAWKYFITELRRNKLLSKKQRKLDYVKVYEVHKLGGLHVHLFSTEFVHWSVLQTIWEKCLSRYFPASKKLGNVNTKAHLTPVKASLYIAKYVTKFSLQTDIKIRAWSKSSKVSLFPKVLKSGNWYLIRKDSLDFIRLQNGEPILVGITPHVTVKTKKQRHKPPDIDIFFEFECPNFEFGYFGRFKRYSFSKEPLGWDEIDSEVHRTTIA